MRFRNTLLLLVVLIGLGAYVYYVERPEAVKEATKEKLVDFQPDEVTEVVLTYPDHEVTLSKVDGAWRITKPIEAEADDVAVKGIVTTLSTAEVKKGLEGEVKDLGAYGLEKPNTVVAMKAGGKALPVVKIGEAAPIGGSAYAMRGDDKKVLLTTSVVRSGVEKTLKDLRNKTILKFSDDGVRRIEVKGEGKELVLEKNGAAWKIVSPAAHDADVATVRSYLSTLRALRATDFPDEKADPSTYGLVEPHLSVILTLGEGGAQQTQTLLVGGANEKKEVFVKTASSPVVYTVGDWVSRDLDKPAEDFRDKTVLAFDKDKAKSLEVTRQDGSSYMLGRGDDGKWKVEKGETPGAPATVAAYVNDVATLKGYEIAADGVADLAAFGLEPPAVRIKVIGPDGAEVGTMLLGQREVDGKKQYTAAKAGSGTVLLVRDYHYARLDKAATDLKENAQPPAPGVAIPPGGQMQMPPDMGAPQGEEEDGGGDVEGDDTEQ